MTTVAMTTMMIMITTAGRARTHTARPGSSSTGTVGVTIMSAWVHVHVCVTRLIVGSTVICVLQSCNQLAYHTHTTLLLINFQQIHNSDIESIASGNDRVLTELVAEAARVVDGAAALSSDVMAGDGAELTARTLRLTAEPEQPLTTGLEAGLAHVACLTHTHPSLPLALTGSIVYITWEYMWEWVYRGSTCMLTNNIVFFTPLIDAILKF